MAMGPSCPPPSKGSATVTPTPKLKVPFPGQPVCLQLILRANHKVCPAVSEPPRQCPLPVSLTFPSSQACLSQWGVPLCPNTTFPHLFMPIQTCNQSEGPGIFGGSRRGYGSGHGRRMGSKCDYKCRGSSTALVREKKPRGSGVSDRGERRYFQAVEWGKRRGDPQMAES